MRSNLLFVAKLENCVSGKDWFRVSYHCLEIFPSGLLTEGEDSSPVVYLHQTEI